MKQNQLRRLPLEGAPNTRDLGGYPCGDGKMTKWGVFLRSSSPHTMTSKDFDYLAGIAVLHAIDLRSDEERVANPTPLEQLSSFSSTHVSLNDQIHATNFEGDLPGSMSGLYISLLDNCGEKLACILRTMANANSGVLFHCAVGKDRTGVVAMLLLKIAGVCDADIVADYCISDVYMREIFDDTLKIFKDKKIPKEVLQSAPKSMWRTLQHLQDTYGDVFKYLNKIGITAKDLAVLQGKFIQNT